ncbi:MAG: GNAT family N-acetyltransferase [Alphaproteobacteria bacterium]|nr:MAG: GNAT family N-acetyltransferase [Alphaproteobacteria bacterium]
MVRRASMRDAAARRSHAANTDALMRLTAIGTNLWRGLSERAIEPNGYYLPEWELAVDALASGHTGASMLSAWNDAGLIGLMPVVSMSRAYKIPLPALVSAHPYGTLCTPPLDRDTAIDAVGQLTLKARKAGARALILRDMSLSGPAMKAFTESLRREDLRPRVLQSYLRASLDATRDAEELLREALGNKKLKELRRQRHRLAEHGAVSFDAARSPDEVAGAIEVFMKLEAGGWKGERGTALAQDEGDAAFIRRATRALAENGQCEIVTLRAGDTPVAAATRHLCADPMIASADSTASPDHPMINPIWRGRFAIGDVLIPLRKNDPALALIHAALVSRQLALDLARRSTRLLRAWRTR